MGEGEGEGEGQGQSEGDRMVKERGIGMLRKRAKHTCARKDRGGSVGSWVRETGRFPALSPRQSRAGMSFVLT
jgi:hypothetical protein